MTFSKLTTLLELLGRRPDLAPTLLALAGAVVLLLITVAALVAAVLSPHCSPGLRARWILAIAALPGLGAALWFRTGPDAAAPRREEPASRPIALR